MAKPPELLPFQAVGVRRISYFQGRVLLADDMGLGKTFQALAWAKRHNEFPLLIICPAVLKINWERECWDKIRERATVLHGRTPPRVSSPTGKRLLSSRVLIINYDILTNWTNFLKRYPTRLLVVDECDRIKNGKTKRARAAVKLNDVSKHLIAISGTPILSRPMELYTVLRMLRPRIFPSKTTFGMLYCDPKSEHGSMKFKGCTNAAELNGLLNQHVMIRRLKKDVLKDLPDKTRSVVPLEMSQAGWDEYSAVVRTPFAIPAHVTEPEKIASTRKAQALSRLAMLKKVVIKHKMPQILEWIDMFLAGGEKLVVFCVHRSVAKTIQERYGRQAVIVNGTVTGRRRQAAVDAFQNNPNTKLLIGNIAAAGVGLTLTASSNVMFCELGWTPPEHIQAEDRVHRIGQKLKCFIYYLIAIGTVEEAIARILQRKQAHFEAVMDGNSKIDDLALVDLINHELERMKDTRHASLFR